MRKVYAQRKTLSSSAEIQNDAFSIITQYQAEYRGIVQYYRMAYNLHTLGLLKHVMEVSLIKTLANKYKTSCRRIHRRYGTTIRTEEGDRKVLLAKVERNPPKRPLVAYFGGVSLKWNKWASIDDRLKPIWSHRSEIVERLLAQKCELCGSRERIEVHHIRKLSDLRLKGRGEPPRWKKRMAARHRKTLVVCRNCHESIHYGKYDGKRL